MSGDISLAPRVMTRRTNFDKEKKYPLSSLRTFGMFGICPRTFHVSLLVSRGTELSNNDRHNDEKTGRGAREIYKDRNDSERIGT